MKILWRRMDLSGFEWCQILQDRSRALIQGLVLLNYKGKICKIEYAIECDPAWQTKSVIIGGTVGPQKRGAQAQG